MTWIFPFSAIVGQDALKQALILNAVNPAIGGVLIRGEKGTAKSTAVRALAALLPEIAVFRGCVFGCGPEDGPIQCDACGLCGSPQQVVRRRVRVVTLPLNSTEDRVAGGIDFEQAIRKGRRVIQPGLLARAHRGILYVDEVNLLDDHLVDVILDAAGSAQNRIEREGISFVHPARFVLVGTMNPEEGELRPQLLDRFGLCVAVAAEADPDRRILTMERREAYDADPRGFCQYFAEQNETIAQYIRQARRNLAGGVVMPAQLRPLVAELCTENHVAGHRADLVIEQAALALAAYREHPAVTLEDIREVAGPALLHRKREAAPAPPPPQREHNHEDPPENNEQKTGEHPHQDRQEQQHPRQGRDTKPEAAMPEKGGEQSGDETQKDNQDPKQEQTQGNNSREQIFEVGEMFKVRKLVPPKDRIARRGSGRRSRTRIAQKQGRYVKSTLTRGRGDVALDATLRAAAPFQVRRKNGNGLAVVLRPEDIREKIREKRIGNFLVFIVDASGSMGARGRMAASKGAIMSLLLDAYQKRDRIAMVSFRRDAAEVNLPPTSSIDLAAGLLQEMPVGGRTPLSAGLTKSYEVLRNYLLRDPTARPIAILITDGRSNVALGDQKPVDEALSLAERLSRDDRIKFIVVDTEPKGLVSFGLARQLAGAMHADYFQIQDLKADTLLTIVKGEV